MGKFFIGFIAFLYLHGKFYLFSTYNKSVVSEIKHDREAVEITVRNRMNILNIKVIKNSFEELIAPVSGEMSRTIKESVDSEVHLKLLDKNDKLKYEGSGKSVGLEIIERIFDYV